MPTINEPAHAALGLADAAVIAELASGANPRRYYVSVVNTDSVPRTFRLNRYDADAAESAAQTNALAWDRTIEPDDPPFNYSFTLTAGWEVSGLASAANVVIVHIDEIEDN